MKKGWEIKKLKDICCKESSNIIQNKIKDLNGDYPIYGASGFLQNVDFYHQKKEYIGIVKDGSGVGRIMLLPAFSSVTGTIQYILPNKETNLKFLSYILSSLNLSKLSQGAAIPHIYFKDYGEIQVPIPPLSEQKRIVSVLDAAFAKIEAVKEKTARNLQNAKELFQSELQKCMSPQSSTNKKGWEIKKLGDFCEIKTGKLNSNEADENGKYPFFTCSRDVFKINSYAFNCEAILLAGNNASGDFNVKHYKGKFNAYQRTYVINQHHEIVSYRIIYYCISMALSALKQMSLGANTRFLKLGMVEGIPIPIPPISEQQQIVSRLDVLSAQVKQLEANYKAVLANCEELKQSILAKVFNGEI